jgi:RHS repeat-associated protein
VALPDSTVIDYVVDGRNRRIGKIVDGVLVRQWLYEDQLEPVAELDGNGSLVLQFTYGSRMHVPDYMMRGGDMYRIISDHLGSVRLVVDISNGSVAQGLDYEEYGAVLTDTEPGWQPFAYAGGIYDAAGPQAPVPGTGLVRFGARDYDPRCGRWLSKDPLKFAGDGTNVFEYLLSDPVNWIDPFGTYGIVDQAGSAQLNSELKKAKSIQAPGVSRQALAGLCRGAKELLRPYNELYKKFTKGSAFDAHHVFQDAVMLAQGFERGLGIAIPLAKGPGGAHAMATRFQGVAKGRNARYVAYGALVAAGCKPADATEIVQAAENFGQLVY